MRAVYPSGPFGIARLLVAIAGIALAVAILASCGGELEGAQSKDDYTADLPEGWRDDEGGGLAGDLIEGGTAAEIDSLCSRRAGCR